MIAVTHVANKMLRIMWAMERDHTLYWYRNEKLYQSKLAKLDKAMRSDMTQKIQGYT